MGHPSQYQAEKVMAEVNNLLEIYIDGIYSLYDRWQDEQGYEDFKEYKTALQNIWPWKISRMTRNPFAFTFFLGGFKIKIKITDKWGNRSLHLDL